MGLRHPSHLCAFGDIWFSEASWTLLLQPALNCFASADLAIINHARTVQERPIFRKLSTAAKFGSM